MRCYDSAKSNIGCNGWVVEPRGDLECAGRNNCGMGFFDRRKRSAQRLPASSYDSGIGNCWTFNCWGCHCSLRYGGVLSYTTPKGNDANDINSCTSLLS